MIAETIAPNGELSRLDIGGSLEFNYSFDATGRITHIDRSDAEGEHHTTYSYNGGRLSKSENSTLGSQTWRYDKLGNRLTQETQRNGDALQRASYAYPSAGEGSRLLGIEYEGVQSSNYSLDGSVAYSYNSAGAPLEVGHLQYTYDNWQRPLTVSTDGKTIAKYSYNAFGERVKKEVYKDTSSPEVTYYLYDGSTLTAEVDATGKIARQYVYLDGHRPIAMLEGNETYAIHTDHIGAPRQMSNTRGEVVWRAEYFAFGLAVVDDESSVLLNLRFPGQYSDNETGTYYNYFRDYDPEVGRYLTSDPLGLIAGFNTYAYVNGLPQNLIDPEGLDDVLVPVLAGSALAAWFQVG